MRDFNTGDITGDVTIYDNSNNYKLLIYCDNNELLAEEAHRKQLLSNERRRKLSITLKLLVLAAILFLISAFWFYFQGHMNAVSFVLGVAGILMTAATLKNSENSTVFELRQIGALKEIDMILRERNAR